MPSDITSVRCKASSPVIRGHHHELDASVGASGPHDFAVRSDVVRLTTSKRPPHPKPNVRGDRAYAPHLGRDGAGDASDLGSRSREKLGECVVHANPLTAR